MLRVAVHVIVLLERIEHRWEVASEERKPSLVLGHALGLVAHGVGGDVVLPAVEGGHFVDFEGAVVLLEDLDEGFAGVAALWSCVSLGSTRLMRIETYVGDAVYVTVFRELLDLLSVHQLGIMCCLVLFAILVE